jgi:hypothetical protein
MMNSKHPSTRLIIFALLLCGCLAIAWWACSQAQARGWNAYLQETDFRPYFTGGYLLAHNPAQVYSLDTQWQTQKTLWPNLQEEKQLLPFIAPPFSALPYAPLSFLPLHSAFIIWSVVNALLLTVLCWLVADELKNLPPKWKMAGYFMTITSVPALATFMQGQLAFLPALAALLAWRNLRRGEHKYEIRGGLFLALLLLKPQLVVLPCLLLVCLRRWRALAGFGIGAVVLSLVSWLCVGASGIIQYANLVREASNWVNQYGVKPQAMLTARGFLHFVFQTDVASDVALWWRIIAVVTLLLWTCSIWQTQQFQKSAIRFDLLWALTLTAAMFLSPYLYTHDMMLMFVVAACLWSACFQDEAANVLLKWLPVGGYLAMWLALFSISRWINLVTASVGLMVSMLLLVTLWIHSFRGKSLNHVE